MYLTVADVDCKRNLKNISLKNAITFQFNGHQNIVISSETGITFVIKLLVKLRALPDKVSIQFNEIRKLKNKLDVIAVECYLKLC